MDYEPKGVKFFYIYKALAHPENDGYVQPFTQAERLLHVKEARRTIGSRVPWICDTMDNTLKHALGDAPNSEFVIDPEGKVVRRRQWSRPDELRRDLEELVGPVEQPTRVSDLHLKTEPPPRVAAKGVVPRIERPAGLEALRIEPELAADGDKKPVPFYAKLRAEADASLRQTGRGKLSIALHLDPLYHVHWNNLMKPLRVEFDAAEDAVTPRVWDGPKVDAASDIDPREFLAEINVGENRQPLGLTVKYFACSDEQGFCLAVTQRYTIHFERDPDAGWVQNRNRRGSRGGGGPTQDGTLVWVDSAEREVSIKLGNGELKTFRLAATARLMRRGSESLRDFEPGDSVRIRMEDGEITGMALP